MHAFDVAGHPIATRAYAWFSPTEAGDKRRFFPALYTNRINSPLEAARGHRREASADKEMKARKGRKLTSEKRLWALRIMWAVRRNEIARSHPDAVTAARLLGPEANEILLDLQAPRTKGFVDVMTRRIAGSFETNRRRH